MPGTFDGDDRDGYLRDGRSEQARLSGGIRDFTKRETADGEAYSPIWRFDYCVCGCPVLHTGPRCRLCERELYRGTI